MFGPHRQDRGTNAFSIPGFRNPQLFLLSITPSNVPNPEVSADYVAKFSATHCDTMDSLGAFVLGLECNFK